MSQKRSFGQVTGATAFGAALTTIILYVIKAVWGVEVDAEVQGAITTLVVLIAGWAVPPKDDDAPDYEIHDELEDGGEVYG